MQRLSCVLQIMDCRVAWTYTPGCQTSCDNVVQCAASDRAHRWAHNLSCPALPHPSSPVIGVETPLCSPLHSCNMTARNLKQQRSRHEPLARDELVQFITRAVANNQQDEIMQELELQRPDKTCRRGHEPASPASSDTPSTREFMLVHPIDPSVPHGPPPPQPVNAPRGHADGGPHSNRGGRGGYHGTAGSGSAGSAPGSARSMYLGSTSDAESGTSSRISMRTPEWLAPTPEAEGPEVFVLPIEPATPLPRGVPSLYKWSRTLLVLPKYREKRWSYMELLQHAWMDKDVMSYVKWVKNTYFQEAKKPQGGKASDLAAFILAAGYPVEERYQVICSTERVFVDE